MAVLCSIAARGATKIDGIYYNFSGSSASVERSSGEKYSGNIFIPSSVTYNGKVYTVTSIGYWAFADCTRLGSVTLPSTIQTIQNWAFQNSSISSIVIPQSVNKIDYPFTGCNNLTSIVVEDGNATFDSRNNCNAIIETAKNSLIAGCKTTEIPEGVETIYYNAFLNITELKNIYIPSSVKNIIYNAFEGCTSLESIEVDNDNETFDSRNNCNAVINTSTNELVLGCKSTVIPNDVVSIGYNAFRRSGITSLVIPVSLTEIKEYTFDGCNMTSIVVEEGNPVFDSRDNCNAIIRTETNTLFWGGPNTVIPASVTTIGSYSFRGCTGLTSIKIPANVTTIEDCAFEGSGLKTLTIPATVTSVGFGICNQCANLTDIYLYAETVPEEHILMEDMYSENITLHVPESALEQYKEQWQNDYYKDIVAISSQWYDITKRYLQNAGFDQDLTWNSDGTTKQIIKSSISLSDRSIAWEAADSSVYAHPTGAKTRQDDIPSTSATNGFLGRIKGWTVSTNQEYPKCEWVYFGSVPYGLGEQAIPIADDGNTFLNVPAKPDSNDNIGALYLRSGWGAWATYSQQIQLPEGHYRLEYKTINVNSSSKEEYQNLCQVECGSEIYKDDLSLSNTSWTTHSIEFDANGYTKIQIGYQSSGGSGSNPFLIIDDVKLYQQSSEGIDSETSEDLNQTTFVEYFIDTDPGLGKATQVEVEVDENGAADFEVPGTALHYGLNLVGIRLMTVFEDGTVSYSPTTLHSVYKYHAQDAKTVGIEYFVNKDPGVGKATRVDLTGENVVFDLPVTQLEVGINVLGLRAISMNSETGVTYGATTYQYVYRSASTGNRPIERIEYFWDVDPGQGNATPLSFTMAGDSAVVDCNINHEGIYGEHVLSVRALAGGVWSPLYQQMVILPNLSPLDGLISLDPDNEEDIETGLFQTLPSLIGALSTRGFNIGIDIHVADANYVFMVSEESLYFVKALYNYMLETNFYLNMKADHQATFNFVLPEEFIYIHQSELPSIVASVQAMFSHVVTENISILINGQVYKYNGFQVEPNDLLALKNLYNRLDGKNWTDKRWSFQSNGRNMDELPGVEFDESTGRVISIDLENNGLKGELSNEWSLNLPALIRLNLSRNSISGDLAPFVADLNSIEDLDVSFNLLTKISKPMTAGYLKDVGDYGLRGQFCEYEPLAFVRYEIGNARKELATQQPVLVYISQHQKLALPTFFTYDMKAGDYSLRQSFELEEFYYEVNDYVRYQKETGDYAFVPGKRFSEYSGKQDSIVNMFDMRGALRARLHYIEGDANMSGATDVLDVQHTLNRILSSATPFNYSAANTYSDDKINVQDIVCTVNIVLNNEHSAFIPTGYPQDTDDQPSLARGMQSDAWLYTENGRLFIASATEMGAIDVELAGVSTSQVSLLLNHKQFQMIGRNTEQGSRYVIFSPTGQPIPAGEATALLKISASAQPVAVLASDMDAQAVSVALDQRPTSIAQLKLGSLKARFDGDQLVVAASSQQENVSLRLLSANGTLIMMSQMDVVDRSGKRVNAHVPSGVYLLEMTNANGDTKVVKLMKR